MKNRKLAVINRTTFATKDIIEIATSLLQGQLAPNFYLLCEPDEGHKGITLTNLDRPTMIIFIEDLEQFAETFVHELTHLKQHSKGYTDEDEAEAQEFLISDKDNRKGERLSVGKADNENK